LVTLGSTRRAVLLLPCVVVGVAEEVAGPRGARGDGRADFGFGFYGLVFERIGGSDGFNLADVDDVFGMRKARSVEADVGVDFVGGLRLLVAVLRLVGGAAGVAFTS